MKSITLLLFGLIPFLNLAQDCDRVLFSGRIQDTIRPQSFYNLMVINRTTGLGVFGQPDGSFSVYVNDGDSLSLSVKGYPVVHSVVNADLNCQYQRQFFVEGKAQEIAEIEVRPLKSLQEIKEQRASLAIRETRLVSGIEVMKSPITALYQAFSKKEKSKRWVAEQEYKDDQVRIVKELLRNYVAYEIVDLSSEQFEDFIYFLNVDENFLKTSSEMELITFIKDKYDHYVSLQQSER